MCLLICVYGVCVCVVRVYGVCVWCVCMVCVYLRFAVRVVCVFLCVCV